MRILSFILLCGALTSCVSKKEEGPIISDATLFELSQTVSSFAYYKNNTDSLTTAPASEHFNFMRVRFNPRAREVMSSDLSEMNAASFPDESMVVKEVYNQKGDPLDHMVVMYKLQGAANGGSGWVWGKFKSDGTVLYSSANKGDQCVGCHSTGANKDLVRTFDLH